MTTTSRPRSPLVATLLAASLVPAAAPAAAQRPPTARVDSVFAAFDGTETPGCAVGVTRDGRAELFRAYGMAELEHDVPNTPETIFEAGSVSKQFTAAATILLALDGKLSLDDDIRKYVPELPDYGTPITIRHLLTHTSGLRDWGSVAGLEGWPRTTRVHTHEHVLDILSRQESLNYPPGERYSYTNSGYNLQAILVERVSGMPFAEFSRRRIFEPLGLTSTQWRDDFTRLVEDRAQAYQPNGEGGFELDMPFENVHGNGGLLTTVGDLLRWTHFLETEKLGREFVREMHRRGVLTSGDTISYASGLMIGDYRGVPQVAHSGSTAGYRAYLARFPKQDVAVAVLCNAAQANAGRLAHEVADLWLGDALAPVASADDDDEDDEPRRGRPSWTPSAAQLASYAGAYHSEEAEATYRFAVEDGGLVLRRRFGEPVPLRPMEEDAFVGRGGRYRFIRDDSGRVTEVSVTVGRVFDMRFERVR